MAMPDPNDPFGREDDEEFRDDVGPYDADDESAEPAELELGDDDARLPWLEGDDEDEDVGGGGGQIALLLLMALAALVLIVGGIWWFTRQSAGETPVADGSVIEAPDAPYKSKPADPGGKEFEGTGDTSFAVSEGETRPAQLGEDGEAPKPGFESIAPATSPAPAASPSAAPAKAPAVATSTPDASGPAVQVGAFSSRKSAESAWDRLSSQYSALSGQRYRVVEGRADIGTVFRLQALPGDAAAARSLCSQLKSAGLDCSVKK